MKCAKYFKILSTFLNAIINVKMLVLYFHDFRVK